MSKVVELLSCLLYTSGSASGFLSSYKAGYYNPLFQLYLDRENGTLSNNEVEATLDYWLI